MQLTPAIAIHLTAALAATLIGPLALWARRGHTQYPRLHRAFGYAWVTLMLVAAFSAIFIQGSKGPRLYGYGLIHLLIPTVIVAMAGAFWYLSRKDVAGHRRVMQITYIAGCLVAGSFTLLPSRYLGDLVWRQWLQLA